MPVGKKLVLIDGHSLAYRAYHALPPSMATTKGELTNAVYGFMTTLLKILKDEQPDYLAVAFDVGRTFRDDMFREYKAQRLSMPDDLDYQFARIRSLIKAFNIPILEVGGYEADDVLGTVARKAEGQGIETVIYTGDTDAFQLISPLTKVVVSRRQFGDMALYDEEAVRERYGLEPRQLADSRGLKGDTSDNIPGVPGIGEKTASDLLQKYGDLDGIYAHLGEITAKRPREALSNHHDQAFLSRDLAIIRRDAPIDVRLDAWRVNDYDPEAVRQILRELEMRSLIERLPDTVRSVPGPMSGVEPQSGVLEGEELGTEYIVVQDEAALRKLARRLHKAKAIALDTETSSQNALETDLVGISLSVQGSQAYYIPVGHHAPAQADLLSTVEVDESDYRCLDLEFVQEQLAPILADPKIPKYGHNIKFDAIVLAGHGMPVEGIAFDTMVAAFLIEPSSRQLSLKTLGFNRLGREMTEITALIGKGKDQITMAQVPISKAAPYACADADVTFCLVELLTEELKAKDAWELFTQIEMPLVPVLIAMERMGVMLDVEYLAELKTELEKRLFEIERRIYQLVGHEFNINSTQQLGKVLFDELKLDTGRVGRTKAGGYSTAAGVLEGLQGTHEVVDLVLEYRQLDKLQSTYVEALPQMVSPKDGRLHTSYNQAGAVTGRLSSSEPNLQNIPIRTELGRRVRKAFVAPPGRKLIAADYSQVELRILAHMSQDKGLLEAFRREEDVHKVTAATIFGVPIGEVTPAMRAIAKTTNYAIVYGISGFGLAARTELSQQEAQQFINSYFEKYPGVKKYLDDTKSMARERGYVETLLGRRRYFPELQTRAGNFEMKRAAERMAINAPVQGTNADIMKIAMAHLFERMRRRKLRGQMILQVHDELVFEVPDGEVETVAKLAREVMGRAYDLQVPLAVEVNVGQNWLEMEEV